MSRRSVAIEQHPFWVAADSLHETLRDLPTPQDGALRSRYLDLFEFFAAVEQLRGQVDAEFATAGPLDQAHAHLNTAAGYVANFASDPTQSAYLDNAQAHLENVRAQLATLPRVSASPAARASLTKAMNGLRSNFDAAAADLSDQFTRALEEATTREIELQAQIQATATRLAEVEQQVDSDEVRLRDALTRNNDAFIAAQSARDDSYKRWIDEQASEFTSKMSPHLANLKTLVAQAKAHRDEIDGLRKQTGDLAELAAGDIIASSFGEYAKTERRAAFAAYAVGAAAVIAGVFVLLAVFGEASSALPWQSLVVKLSITAGLGAVATVGFRYGGHATQRATSFKRQELELRSLKPLLMDVEGADDAKVKFVKRAFGHAWTPNGDPDGEDAADALSKVADLAQSALKAGAPHSP